MGQTIVNKLDYLLNDILYHELASWLHPKLESMHGKSWWAQGVYANLTERQKAKISGTKQGKLSELDLQALLHVVTKNFMGLNKRCAVSWDLRTPLESVRNARNALSHRKGGRSPEPEDLLLHALNTKKLLTLIEASGEAIDEADKLVKAIVSPELEGEDNSTPGISTHDDHKVLLQDQPPVKNSSLDKNDVTVSEDPSVSEFEMNDPTSKHYAEEQAKSIFEPLSPVVAESNLFSNPLEGRNRVVSAHLKDLQKNDGTWHMRLVLGPVGQEFHSELTVPPYLSDSAKAAADILDAIRDRKNPPPIQIKLLNVFYSNRELWFPDDPNGNGDAYPLVVIQPSYMINVTSLTDFDYCPRNYLMNRYTIPQSNKAMQRGGLVHSVFDFMLKNPGNREGLMEHCHTELDQQLPELTKQGVSFQEYYQDARHHLNALAQGVDKALDPASFEDLYIERYMINPDLGLKGKIDAVAEKKNGNIQAIELKTGKSWGEEANQGHAFQVFAYHLLLSQANITPLASPSIVYTGNQAKRMQEGEQHLPPHKIVKTPTFSPDKAIEIINLRNELVRIDYTGQLYFNTNDNKCRACVRNRKAVHCINLHGLGLDGGHLHSEHLNPLLNHLDLPEVHKGHFKSMNRALLEEFQAIRIEHGQALQATTESRIAQGICLRVKKAENQGQEGFLTLKFPVGNSSEFRAGDPCLLSDKDGPVGGNCIEVYLDQIDKDQAVVSLPRGVQDIWFEPANLDKNAPDAAFERNFAALYELWAPKDGKPDTLDPIRRFICGEANAFRSNIEAPCDIKNVWPLPLPVQKRAIGLAKGLKDILLVQGPPGTGKTYTLALVVQALAQEGLSIAVTTYTHRAADEIISNLKSVSQNFDVRRLGRPEAGTKQHNENCLNRILERKDEIKYTNRVEMLNDLESRQNELKQRLSAAAVYIGTTNAWLSGKYDTLPRLMSDGQQALFDVVIADEASQIITPNLIGALRLAKRWILVGDHKQLPPIIIGDTSSKVLHKTLFEEIAEYPSSDKTLLVQLDTQHRMPTALSDFIGSTFYGGNLETSENAAQHKMHIKCTHPLMTTHHCIALVDIEQPSADSYHKQFENEAKWAACTLKQIFDQGWPLKDKKDKNGKPTVGIIAPYRAQVALLRRILGNELKNIAKPEFWNDVVDTVDRFQGDERDIIILSLCLRKGSERISRIYKDERRINVSLSRAKKKLWVIGCIDEMQRIPAMKAFREYVAKHPEVCTVESADNLLSQL